MGRLLIKILQKNRTSRIIWVCVCVCVCVCVRMHIITKLCLTLWDPRDCSPPNSSVWGIFQARILEQIAISYSRESSRSWDQTHIPVTLALAGRHFTTEPLVHIIIGYIVSRYFVWRILHEDHIVLTPTKLCSGIFLSVQKKEDSKKKILGHTLLFFK